MAGSRTPETLGIIFYTLIHTLLYTLVVYTLSINVPTCCATYQRNGSTVGQVYVGIIRINSTWHHDFLDTSSNQYKRLKEEILIQITEVLNETVFRNFYEINPALSFRPSFCFLEIAIYNGQVNNLLPHNLTQILKEGFHKIYNSSQWTVVATDVWFIDSKDGLNSGLPQPKLHTTHHVRCISLTFPPCMGLGYNNTVELEFFSPQTSPSGYTGLTNYRHHSDILSRNCSLHTLDFVCSLSYPRCHGQRFVLPCKRFCEEIYSKCNYVEICNEFVDDDDADNCYMPDEMKDNTFPKVLPASCGDGHYLCNNLECINSINRCDGAIDCTDSSDEANCTIVPANPLRCDFDHFNWCGFFPSFDSNFRWRLVRAGSVLLSRGDHGDVLVLRDHTSDSTSGWVALAHASGKNPHDVSRMLMRPHTSFFHYCLHFHYVIPSQGSSSTLNVYLSYGLNGGNYPSFSPPMRVWQRKGWSPHWRHGQIDLQPGKVKVVFEVVRGLSYHGNVMLDDVSIVLGKCPPINCSTTEYLCRSSNNCIGLERLCDRINDCGDNSDESDCSCTPDEFTCTTGGCIERWKRCNMEVDCYDGSDEQHCVCPLGQVNCSSSGKCIMSEWICDGEMDCEGGEDELNCSVCSENEFECSRNNKECIPLVERCDGRMDCEDGHDEIGCFRMNDASVMKVLHKNMWRSLCAENVTEIHGDMFCKLIGMNKLQKNGVIPHPGDGDDDDYLHLKEILKNKVALFELKSTCLHYQILTFTCEPQACASFPSSLSNPSLNKVRGHPMNVETWPFTVGLFNDRSRKCGASLIDSRHLLTAAHCFDGVGDLSKYYVSRGVEKIWIEGVFIHPHYSKTSYWINDLAVIRLEESMTSFTPVCLIDEQVDEIISPVCYSSRWIYSSSTASYYLNQTKLMMWDNDKCKESYHFLSENNFCAGYQSGVGRLCQGDSGNSLLCKSHHGWRMVGIFSFLFGDCHKPMKPSGFLNITKYVPWIRTVTRCPFSCDEGELCLWKSSLLCDGRRHCRDGTDENDELCERNVSCNFEDPRLCGYEHVIRPMHGKWFGARMTEEPTSINWGPLFDHTLGNSSGHFLLGGSKSCSILSPTFTSEKRSCLQFYFTFREKQNNGNIRFIVYLHNASSIDRNSLPSKNDLRGAFIAPQNAFKWEPVKIDVPIGRFFVEFRIQRSGLLRQDIHGNYGVHGYVREDYVGLDDVSLISGECQREVCDSGKIKCENRNMYSCEDRQRRCNIVYDCDGPSDEQNCTDSQFTCTMENIRDCNFVQPGRDLSDDRDWTILPVANTHMLDAGGPFYDHTFKTTAGHVAYFSSVGLDARMRAYLIIPVFLSESSGTTGCFRFHLSIISRSSLKVFLSVRRSSTRLAATFERLHHQDWTEIEIPINNQIENIFLQAEVLERPHRGPDYIAIDDITINRRECSNKVIPALKCYPNIHGGDQMFRCKDGSGCIGDNLVCDLHSNCNDGSDEWNCDHFQCFGGQWDKSLLCNGYQDCLFGEDESQCSKCRHEFECISGNVTCIPLIRRCDGRHDCADGSDEKHCVIQNQDGVLQGFKKHGHHPFCAQQWDNTWNEDVCDGINGGLSFQVASIFEIFQDGSSNYFLIPINQSLLSSDGDHHHHHRFNLDNFNLSQDCPSGRVIHLVCMPHECGLPSLEPPHTTEGGISIPGQWPYVVSIHRYSVYICTGILIHESWVLTAAHCFIRGGISNHSYNMLPKIHSVRGGSILREDYDPDAQTIRVKRIHIDTYFNERYFNPDIALVELELPLATGDLVMPACLPTPSFVPDEDCFLVGWNILNVSEGEANDRADHLMYVNVNVTTDGGCPHLQGQTCIGNMSESIRGFHTTGGGTLMCKSSTPDRWNVAGIVSNGNFVHSSSSDHHAWMVFTVVQKFMDWISLVMMSFH